MSRKNLGLFFSLCLIVSLVSGQTGQWTTFGHDPQRSGVAGDEYAFSLTNVSHLGLLWKTVVPNQPLI